MTWSGPHPLSSVEFSTLMKDGEHNTHCVWITYNSRSVITILNSKKYDFTNGYYLTRVCVGNESENAELHSVTHFFFDRFPNTYEREAVGRKYWCRSPLWFCHIWELPQRFHVQLGSNLNMLQSLYVQPFLLWPDAAIYSYLQLFTAKIIAFFWELNCSTPDHWIVIRSKPKGLNIYWLYIQIQAHLNTNKLCGSSQRRQIHRGLLHHICNTFCRKK